MCKLTGLFPLAGILACAYLLKESEKTPQLSQHSRKYISKGYHSLGLKQYLVLSTRGHHPLWTSVITIRKPILETSGYFPEGVVNCEDMDLWLRIMAQTELAWSPYIGATYFDDTVNKLTKHNTHNIYDLRPTFERLIESYRGTPTAHLLKKHKNYYIVLKVIPKIKDGEKAILGDFSGIYVGASPWLSFEALLLLILPVAISNMLLYLRRAVRIRFLGFFQERLENRP